MINESAATIYRQFQGRNLDKKGGGITLVYSKIILKSFLYIFEFFGFFFAFNTWRLPLSEFLLAHILFRGVTW